MIFFPPNTQQQNDNFQWNGLRTVNCSKSWTQAGANDPVDLLSQVWAHKSDGEKYPVQYFF